MLELSRGASKPGFGQWFQQVQQQEELERNGVQSPGADGAASSWMFWQQSEKKTDGDPQSLLPLFFRGQAAEETDANAVIMGLSYSQRFKLFVATLTISALFFVLAFFIGLPTLVLRPAKFALTFTCGSLCFMISFAMLKGPSTHIRSMCIIERLPFTILYLGSMLGTLYACLIMRSYIVVIALAAAQLVSLLWYFVSFLPGGKAGIKYVLAGMLKMARYTVLPCLQNCAQGSLFCLRRAAGSMASN
ncbi:unnamed protein product [Phaeothamnion confervicola]